MSRVTTNMMAVALLCGAIAAGQASAHPLISLSRTAAVGPSAEKQYPLIEVHSRGRRVAAGIAGAIIGGIIASQGYRYDPYGYYAPYAGYPVYGPYPIYPFYDDAITYCIRRFRSYDPGSMTYVGRDGLASSLSVNADLEALCGGGAAQARGAILQAPLTSTADH